MLAQTGASESRLHSVYVVGVLVRLLLSGFHEFLTARPELTTAYSSYLRCLYIEAPSEPAIFTRSKGGSFFPYT